jgi:hypothetical protein
MSKSINEQIQALVAAKTRDEMIQISNRIAEIGEPAIPELLQYANQLSPRTGKLATVIRIFQKIGYPANRLAIPLLVSTASNTNSSGWEEAMDTLIEIGEPALSEVHNAIQFYSKDLDFYNPEIQGLATLLKLMGSPTIDSLLPDLVFLLKAGTDENHVDEYALWALRKIGSPKADVVLGYLSEIISSYRSKEIRKASIEALNDFDRSTVRSLIPVLRNCLFDDEEAVRHSAEEILQVLGEV